MFYPPTKARSIIARTAVGGIGDVKNRLDIGVGVGRAIEDVDPEVVVDASVRPSDPKTRNRALGDVADHHQIWKTAS